MAAGFLRPENEGASSPLIWFNSKQPTEVLDSLSAERWHLSRAPACALGVFLAAEAERFSVSLRMASAPVCPMSLSAPSYICPNMMEEQDSTGDPDKCRWSLQMAAVSCVGSLPLRDVANLDKKTCKQRPSDTPSWEGLQPPLCYTLYLCSTSHTEECHSYVVMV